MMHSPPPSATPHRPAALPRGVAPAGRPPRPPTVRTPIGFGVAGAATAALLACAPAPDPAPVDPAAAASPEEDVTGPRQTADEWVAMHPTYGHRVGDAWIIPLRIRVQEDRSWLTSLVARVARSLADLDPAEMETFRERIHHFATDSESREFVAFTFEGDPAGRGYRLEDPAGEPVRTDLNGVARGYLTVPDKHARELLARRDGDDGWLTLRATSEGHAGTGRVRLIEGEGLSVISDIDDTVKITGLPAGARMVVRNTFFEPWRAAPGMVERFRAWAEDGDGDGDVVFHFVSAGPWQLAPHLADFLFDDAGFPESTVHMREVRRHPLSIRTWRDLYDLVTEDAATYRYKVDEVQRILERFPEREFILVGDSGQDDPEAYQTVQARFPDQVREIVIRDVVGARHAEPERLEGMTVIPAEPVVGAFPAR